MDESPAEAFPTHSSEIRHFPLILQFPLKSEVLKITESLIPQETLVKKRLQSMFPCPCIFSGSHLEMALGLQCL